MCLILANGYFDSLFRVMFTRCAILHGTFLPVLTNSQEPSSLQTLLSSNMIVEHNGCRILTINFHGCSKFRFSNDESSKTPAQCEVALVQSNFIYLFCYNLAVLIGRHRRYNLQFFCHCWNSKVCAYCCMWYAFLEGFQKTLCCPARENCSTRFIRSTILDSQGLRSALISVSNNDESQYTSARVHFNK